MEYAILSSFQQWNTDIQHVIELYNLVRQYRGRRRIWMRPIFARRNEAGNRLFDVLAEERVDTTIKKYIRMPRALFQYLLTLLLPKISRMNTHMRVAITAKERLSITLRYLATGASYSDLQFLFRVSVSSISTIIPEVCDRIVEALREYVKMPCTPEEWLEIAKEFEEKWGFLNSIGAMDGMHVALQAPNNSQADYFNYKKFYSVVLLAIVDANYNFLFVDVGCKGRISDGGVLRQSILYEKLEKNELNIPEPRLIAPEHTLKTPYMLIGDKAFALKPYCIRPYSTRNCDNASPERIFNARLSRARQVVESTFGILTARFRVLRTTLLLQPEVANKIILATVYLHNFLRNRASSTYMAQTSLEMDQQITTPLNGIYQRSNENMVAVRDQLKHYYAQQVNQ